MPILRLRNGQGLACRKEYLSFHNVQDAVVLKVENIGSRYQPASMKPNPHHPDWNWWFLSKNESVVTSIDVVRSHPTLPWDWWGLVINTRVDPLALLTHHAREISTCMYASNALEDLQGRLCGYRATARKAVDDIIATRVKPSCAEYEVDVSDILAHKGDVDWDWAFLVTRDDLTTDHLREHPDVPWDLKEYWRFHPDRSSEHWTPGAVPFRRLDLWVRFLDCKAEVGASHGRLQDPDGVAQGVLHARTSRVSATNPSMVVFSMTQRVYSVKRVGSLKTK
ncbi:hypothetical protein CEUSTIGMA_g13477.t1 [Chlamydomonas eustigma]|uniref:Uncharacterized protein n=1 Tax=Chlamydomonas eustigma TaxID=1157962 RepID=A0A250XSS0_9CHLO|nr:hypothetical protein CEUSTIGMA_g13477.t1 [Chlamydomonas eustigma]|eukprot:GAX86063.1 hypothetical protein CEUSTIGMA_g13477.t1 [Chlamydomonas eustigma]